MFICEECIRKYDVSTDLNMLTFRSMGPCEDCKEVHPCYDIHHSLLKLKKHVKAVIEALKDKRIKILPRFGISRDEERCPTCGRPPRRWI